jgi:hypothetical protein
VNQSAIRSISQNNLFLLLQHQVRKLGKHQNNLQEGSGALGSKHEKARLVSNKTHYRPTDPDARISAKPDNLITIAV